MSVCYSVSEEGLMFKVEVVKTYLDGATTVIVCEIDGWIRLSVFAQIKDGKPVLTGHTDPRDVNTRNTLNVKEWGLGKSMEAAYHLAYGKMYALYPNLIKTPMKSMQLALL